MSNQSTFAIAYRRATADMMEAVGSFNPTAWLDSAKRNANRAELAAANIIEESLASKLLASIESSRILMGVCYTGNVATGELKYPLY